MTKSPIEFVLAGCHAGDPLGDLPALPGAWRWYVDRWTAPMPAKLKLSARVGAPVNDWPIAFDEQVACALEHPCVLLVRGDPLVATPHRHLVDHLKAQGRRVMVRRRLGIAELAAEFASRKPRVLPCSAAEQIEDHLANLDEPLLVVTDADDQDLSRYLSLTWSTLWLSHLGSERAFVGRHQPMSDLLSLLFVRRQAEG